MSESKIKKRILKAMSPGEVADLYSITTKTLKTWLEPFAELIGKRQGKYFNVRQVTVIYDCMGIPTTKKKTRKNIPDA